ATSSATRRQNARARSRVSGCMKLTDAPPSTQSISTSQSDSIIASSTQSTRRGNGNCGFIGAWYRAANTRRATARSALDPCASAAGDVRQLIERDLAGVAHGAHQQRAVRDAEVHAFLRRASGQEAVGEPGSEAVPAADAVFDLEVFEIRAVVEFSVR